MEANCTMIFLGCFCFRIFVQYILQVSSRYSPFFVPYANVVAWNSNKHATDSQYNLIEWSANYVQFISPWCAILHGEELAKHCLERAQKIETETKRCEELRKSEEAFRIQHNDRGGSKTETKPKDSFYCFMPILLFDLSLLCTDELFMRFGFMVSLMEMAFLSIRNFWKNLLLPFLTELWMMFCE